MSERSSGKIKQPVVLPGLQGKGNERTEAFLLTAFLVTFVATKVTGPPAAKSGYAPRSHPNFQTFRLSDFRSISLKKSLIKSFFYDYFEGSIFYTDTII